MDKPHTTMNSFPVVRKPWGGLNNERNVEYIDKLTLKGQELAPTIKDHYGREHDECLYSEILKRPSFSTSFDWSTVRASGDLLKRILIMPNVAGSSRTPGAIGTTANNVPVTNLDALASFHTFWRGTIRMHIKLVKSQFVTGTMRIAVLYGHYEDTASSEESNTQYWVNLNMQDKDLEYTFDIPYVADTFYKRVTMNGADNITVAQRRLYCTGVIYFVVINPLAVTANVPLAVDVMVFFSSPDMRFFYLNPYSGFVFESSDPGFALQQERKPEIELQSGAHDPTASTSVLDGKYEMNDGIIVLGNRVGDSGYYGNLVEYRSMKDFFKAYWLYSTSGYGTLVNNPLFETVDSSGICSVSQTIGRFLRMYAAWRGGLRWKYLLQSFRPSTSTDNDLLKAILASTSWVGQVMWTPINASATLGVSENAVFKQVLNSQTPYAEVETSMTTELNFLLNKEIYSGTWELETGTLVSNVYGAYQALRSTIFVSGADDFRPGIFIGPYLSAITELVLLTPN